MLYFIRIVTDIVMDGLLNRDKYFIVYYIVYSTINLSKYIFIF